MLNDFLCHFIPNFVCLLEKTTIMHKNGPDTLNVRSEIYKRCPYRDKKLVKKLPVLHYSGYFKISKFQNSQIFISNNFKIEPGIPGMT